MNNVVPLPSPMMPRAWAKRQAVQRANDAYPHNRGSNLWTATYLYWLGETERNLEKAIAMEDASK